MPPWRDRRVLAGAGALATAAAGAALLQRHHNRQIAGDPDNDFLRNPPRGRPVKVRSTDGTELHAEVFGAEDKPTMVLAHGWTESLVYWAYVIRALREDLRIVAYDLRGHGQSARGADGDYAVERFGEDLEAVLEQCVPDGRRAIVVGHSLGAMSIAAWAEHHDVERRAEAAALLNTGVGELVAETLLIPVPWIANALNSVGGSDAFLKARAPVPPFSTPLSSAIIRYVAFGPAATAAQVAFYERMLVACAPDVRADVGIALSALELHHALVRLTVPTIVVAGENDRLTPPTHAERIASELPDLRDLIVLPATGHMGPLERPDEVSALLGELAASVSTGTASVSTGTASASTGTASARTGAASVGTDAPTAAA
jgi:pimeloyl-ACP methyl ester carboxylesterase